MAYTLQRQQGSTANSPIHAIASSSVGESVTGFYYGWLSTVAQAGRTILQRRNNNGIGPTAGTPEKFNTRSAAANGTYALLYGTDPTVIGNPAVLVARSSSTTANVPTMSWRAPNPRYPVVLEVSETIALGTLPNNGFTNVLVFSEPRDMSVAIRGRRNRRPGYGDYTKGQVTVLPAVITNPFMANDLSQPMYLNALDWPETVNQSQGVMALLLGASGVTYTDSGTATITLSGTSTESASANDSRTGTITLSGTKTESASGSGSGTVTITLSGTKTETAVFADSRTATITLSGSFAQSWTVAEARSGTITLTGFGSENFVPPGGGTGIDNAKQVDPNLPQQVSQGVR